MICQPCVMPAGVTGAPIERLHGARRAGMGCSNVKEQRVALSSTRKSDAADDYAEEVLRYRAALIDHVSDALIATTVDGIVTSWNPAAEAIYGRSAAQALALPVSEAVGASLDLPAVVNDGGVVHTTHYTSDGAALAVRVSVAGNGQRICAPV